MASYLRHFAIHADNVDRARCFYEAVFGWRFEAWGPPGYYLIRTGTEADRGIGGALQQRQTPLSGEGMHGFECTISVDALNPVLAAVQAQGGTLLSQPFVIDGVSRLVFIHDTEGNRLGVMQYDPDYPL